MTLAYTPLLCCAGALVIPVLIIFYVQARRGRSLPPGPPGLPIVGNLFEMPKEEEWIHWAKFYDIYGPISAVRVLGQPIILLNSLQVCNDLLEKRSATYAGRPILHFLGELVGWDRQLILSADNDRFKVMRKLFSQFIGTRSAIAALSEPQEWEARWFVLAMLEKPDRLLENLRLAISAISLKTAYGYSPQRDSPDALITLVETAAREFYLAASPGAWLVDSIPLLKYVPAWFPGARFQRIAAQFRRTLDQSVSIPLEMVKQRMADNTATPCFATYLLEHKMSPAEEEVLPCVTTSLYAGGQDTVSATLGAFFLAMVLHPDPQRQAQREIESIVGVDRLPRASDVDSLPYLAAVLKEVTRWHVVAAIDLPHATTRDDYYEGYYIPKGSIVLANLWRIANDEVNYANPAEFRPERFLGDKPELDPTSFVFGFGRRRCPGIELARTTCLTMMATTLALLDIAKAKDENGQDVTPDRRFIPGTVSHPAPFPYDLRPRSGKAAAVLASDLQVALGL